MGTCRDLVVDYVYSVQHANTSWRPGPATFYAWAVSPLLTSTFSYATLLASDTWVASTPVAVDTTNATWPRARYERANLTAGPGLSASGTFYLGMFFEQSGYGTALEAGVRACYDPTRRPFAYVDASANFLADPLLSAPQVMFTTAPTHTDYYTFDDDFSTATSAGPVTRLWLSAALYCPINATAAAAATPTVVVSATKPPFLASASPPLLVGVSAGSRIVSISPGPLPTATPPPLGSANVTASAGGEGDSPTTTTAIPTPTLLPSEPAAAALVTPEEVGIVVGVAVAFVILILVVLGGYYYWQRRRQSARRLRDLMRDPATRTTAGPGAGGDDAVTVHLDADKDEDANELKPIAPFTDAPDEDEGEGKGEGGPRGPPIVVDNGRITIRHVEEMPIPGLDDQGEDAEDKTFA